MNGPDSISDPVARRLCCTESYPSARLQNGSARGSHVADVSADWSMMWLMTWHAYCACWHHTYIRLMSSLACLLCMLTSQLCHADVINIRVSHVGRVNWYSGRVSPSGRRRRVGRVCARRQTPCRRVMESAAMSDVRFWRRFHQWLRLFLLYTVVWSKHNFDNFHFWAKIKHHFKPYALIPIVGNSDRWCSDICPLEAKHTDTIFNVVRQTAYIHGRSHCII
jgi:hypothetical protein